MLIDSSDLAKAFIIGNILFGVVILVAPAMLTARWCAQLMPRLSTKEAMLIGAATSTAAFYKGRRENVPRGRPDRLVWAVENRTTRRFS